LEPELIKISSEYIATIRELLLD